MTQVQALVLASLRIRHGLAICRLVTLGGVGLKGLKPSHLVSVVGW